MPSLLHFFFVNGGSSQQPECHLFVKFPKQCENMCAMAVQNANESRDHICKDGSETLTFSVPMPSMATYARMTLCNRAHKREISDVDVGTIFSLSCEYHMGSLSVVDWPDRSICCHRFCISFSSILFCLFFFFTSNHSIQFSATLELTV